MNTRIPARGLDSEPPRDFLGEPRPLWTDFLKTRYLRRSVAESVARLALLRLEPLSNVEAILVEEARLAGLSNELAELENRFLLQ